MSKKNERYIYIILFLIPLLLGYCLIYNGHEWGDDFAEYVAQGIALENGSLKEWIAANQFIASNSPANLCTEIYPWGMPILLAGIVRLFGLNFFAFKMSLVLFVSLILVVLYIFLCRFFKRKISFLLSIVYVMSLLSMNWINKLTADIPFVFFTILAMLFACIWIDNEYSFNRYAVLFAVSGFCAYLFKSQGAVIFMSFIVIHMVHIIKKVVRQNKFKARDYTVQILPYIIILLLLLLSNILPKGRESTFYFLKSTTIDTLKHNFLYYIFFTNGLLPKRFSNIGLIVLCDFVNVIVDVFCIIGIVTSYKKKESKVSDIESFLLLYLLLFVALLIVFPWVQGIRYLFTVFLVVIIFAVQGYIYVAENITFLQLKKVGLVFLIVGCFAIFAYTDTKAYQNMKNKRDYDQQAYSIDALNTYSYINKHTNPDCVVYFAKPRLLWLQTHRLSFCVSSLEQNTLVPDYLLFSSDGYIYDPEDYSKWSKWAANKQLSLVRVYSNNRFELYQLVNSKNKAE